MRENETRGEPRQSLGDAFYRTVLDGLVDGVYFVDPDRRITYWNHGAEQLTGYSTADMIGRHCWDDLLSHVDAAGTALCRNGCPLAATISDGEEREAQVWLRERSGSRRPVLVRTAPIDGPGGSRIGAVEVFTDNSDVLLARKVAEEARRDSMVDELTGIPNRRFFNLMLAARLEDFHRYGTPLAFLMADLDLFKAVNDRYGHPVGDALLRAVAATLAASARTGDLVARWGGEEFCILAQHVDGAAAGALAERLRALTGAVRVDPGVGATVSIGVGIAELGDGPERLLARADAALYQAKATGRNRTVIGSGTADR